MKANKRLQGDRKKSFSLFVPSRWSAAPEPGR